MKVIFHMDFDAFFASVEEKYHPEYSNKPLIVGSHNIHGVVCACNYLAKSYGIKAGMPMFKALKLIKNPIISETHHDLYIKESDAIFKYIKNTYSQQMLIYSIDECWIAFNFADENWAQKALSKAKLMQEDIYNKFQLSLSIGISFNLFLAKMASDYKKPYGITIIKDRLDIQKKLWPLDIEKMFMIGKNTANKLKEYHICTIQDLALCQNYQLLESILNKNYMDYVDNANGIGSNQILLNQQKPKSLSIKRTLNAYIDNENVLLNYVLSMSEELANSLYQYRAKTTKITLVLENKEHKLYKKDYKFNKPTNDLLQINNASSFLFNNLYKNDAIRSIAFYVSKTIYEYDKTQLTLHDLAGMDEQRKKNIKWQNDLIKMLNYELDDDVAKRPIEATNAHKHKFN